MRDEAESVMQQLMVLVQHTAVSTFYLRIYLTYFIGLVLEFKKESATFRILDEGLILEA